MKSNPTAETPPTSEALKFAHECRWPDSRIDLARLIDEAAAEQAKNWLARKIGVWIEECQPTDLQNRTTAELQDELQRRKRAAKFERNKGDPRACPHGFLDWDDCPDCRH